MISDPDGGAVLSSLGWVEGDALWRLDLSRGGVDLVACRTGARHGSLHHHAGAPRFAVAHHFDGRRFEVSVRSFLDPGSVLARAVIEPGASRIEGDAAAWAGVPCVYVEYLGFPPWNDFALVNLSSDAAPEVQRLPWYDESYDKDFQGVVDALELPGAGVALVSVQRSSRLIVHDLGTGEQRGAIDLGGRGGNPRLQLRAGGREVWASDYDTLVAVRTDTWQVRRRSRLQTALAGTQQFIGEFAFAPDGAACAVARPFSGDAVGIDAETLRVTRVAKLGRQPLEVAALRGGEVVARDWKTGELLRGELRRRWAALSPWSTR